MTADPLIDVYHEILMNEVGVMRGNTPVTWGLRVGDAIYYLTGFAGKSVTSTPRRGLDFVLLAYAVINGLRRRYCGYDPTKPSYWDRRSKCDCIKEIYDGLQHDLGKRPTGLKDLLVEIITALMNPGLLKPIPSKGIEKDTVTPKKYLNASGKAVVRDDVDMRSLSLATLLRDFFKADCPGTGTWDISEVLKAEEEVLRRAGLLTVLSDNEIMYYKTAHGELFRALANASSLPGYLANFEARVLPFLAEPPPPKPKSSATPKVPVSALLDPLTAFLRANKVSQARAFAEAVIRGLSNAGFADLNPYQAAYLLDALKKGLRNTLIALTSPTGSGKTLVFTIIAVAAAIAGKLSGSPQRTIITYPRKSLAREQLQRLIDLVNHINDELVATAKKLSIDIDPRIRIAIRDGDSLEKASAGTAAPLRGLRVKEPGGKELALCHGIDGNGGYYVEAREDSCDGRLIGYVDWVIDVKESVKVVAGSRKFLVYPLRSVLGAVDIVITNNSMLSKLGFDVSAVSPHRKTEWVEWLKRLRLLVIDEAHVFMDPEELEKMFLTITRLLWAIASAVGAATIMDYARISGIGIIVSSATLTESKLFKVGGRAMHTQNVVGVLRLPACTDPVTGPPPEVSEFLRKLLGNGLFSVLGPNILYRDYYTEVTCSGRPQGSNSLKGLIKLNVYAVTLPSPERSSWTSLAESMVAVLHWIHALRTQSDLSKALAIVFIDNKESQRHILKLFAERQILDAVDHADRVLMSVLYSRSQRRGVQRDGYRVVWGEVAASAGRSLFEVAWDIGRPDRVFSTFHGLGLYHSTAVTRAMMGVTITRDQARMISALRNAFPHITWFIDGLIDYAHIFLGHSGVWHPVDAVNAAMSAGVPVGFVIHNANLGKRQRLELENHIRDGVPYLVMTTSTLEVGIDIPHAVAVLQYASTPTTAELIQRFGRSGRDKESLYVTTGVLVLRNTGEDVQYLSDEDAVRYVFGLKFPNLPTVEDNVEALVKNVVSMIVNTGANINPAMAGKIAKNYLTFLGISNSNAIWEASMLATEALKSVTQMRGALARARAIGDCTQANNVVGQAISELITDFNLYMKNNPALTTIRDGQKAISIMNDFISKTLSGPVMPQDNLGLAIYTREELASVIGELMSATRNLPPQAANQVRRVLTAAEKLLRALTDAITICVQTYVLSSQAGSKKSVSESFINHITRPGIIDRLGNLKEAYGIIGHKTMHQGGTEVEVRPFNALMRRAAPAKHKGG